MFSTKLINSTYDLRYELATPDVRASKLAPTKGHSATGAGERSSSAESGRTDFALIAETVDMDAQLRQFAPLGASSSTHSFATADLGQRRAHTKASVRATSTITAAISSARVTVIASSSSSCVPNGGGGGEGGEGGKPGGLGGEGLGNITRDARRATRDAQRSAS
jgi:hypothetical protein